MGNIFEVLDFSKLFVVLLTTILPSVLMLSLILYSDRKSREPLPMILICILSGAFTICFSLIIDKLIVTLNIVNASMFPSQNSYSVYRIMVLAGVEEYAKLLVLHLFLYKNKSYDDILDDVNLFVSKDEKVFIYNEQLKLRKIFSWIIQKNA